jgi:hypothetical protein
MSIELKNSGFHAFLLGFRTQFDAETFSFVFDDGFDGRLDLSTGPEIRFSSHPVPLEPHPSDCHVSFARGAWLRLLLRREFLHVHDLGFSVRPFTFYDVAWVPVYMGDEKPVDVVTTCGSLEVWNVGAKDVGAMEVDLSPFIALDMILAHENLMATELFVAGSVAEHRNGSRVPRPTFPENGVRSLPFRKWGDGNSTVGEVILAQIGSFKPCASGLLLSLILDFADLYEVDKTLAIPEPVVFGKFVDDGIKMLVCELVGSEVFDVSLLERLKTVKPLAISTSDVLYGIKNLSATEDDEQPFWPVGFGSLLFVSPQGLVPHPTFDTEWINLCRGADPPSELAEAAPVDQVPREPVADVVRQAMIQNYMRGENALREILIAQVRKSGRKLLAREIRSINEVIRRFRATTCPVRLDRDSVHNVPDFDGIDIAEEK